MSCCIAGCGPAGAMLGLLLARAGVDVVVLEKHADFLRDFRGDTLHPSTLELMDQLGLAEKVHALPHSKVSTATVRAGGEEAQVVDLTQLRTPFPYIMFVPQWDFLDLITAEARRYPHFRLLMEAEVEGLLEAGGRVMGVRYRVADGGHHEVRAELTVAADGRDSTLRAAAGLRPKDNSAPLDVLWFRISRREDDPEGLSVRIGAGEFVVLLNRFTYWQVGYLILKGTQERVRAAGLEAFRRSLARLVPEVADRVGELADWDQVKTLSIRSNRLPRWYRPGLLCIGDAAHAMTPVAGVGINLAIQDAVVAANVLVEPLRYGRVSVHHLRSVQRRRAIPVRIVQAFQSAIQNRLQTPVLRAGTAQDGATRDRTAQEGGTVRMPRALALAGRIPVLRRIPARLVGKGVWRVRLSRRLEALSTPLPDSPTASRDEGAAG
ncbi:FAD-dependent oxidoreductase [Actinopolymorpha sp. B9G3]|uniref:FAD-dependent oxidoreductase n=1 Tax=Actinopolymorpha sp. B9G3 TaxID=3158970 RepID=UPI0032D96371